MKRLHRILSVFLVAVMVFPPVAFAADKGSVPIEQCSDIITTQSKEIVGSATEGRKYLAKAPEYSDFANNAEIIDYIQNGPKAFFTESDTITIEELLSKSQPTKAGDVSGTFTSARFNTGTPGVTWDYTVNYTISPMPSGTGWYFKNVSCTVSAYKGFWFYTWGSGILEFTSATYSLLPSTRPTSITVYMTLKFQIWTNATGVNHPITYSEDHNHTTKISNIYS